MAPRTAHVSVPASSANLGATNVAAIARQIEHSARGGDLNDLASSVIKLRAQRTVALSELEALENSAKVAHHLVEVDGLRKDVDEAECAEPFEGCGIDVVRQTDGCGSVPQLLFDDGDRRWIGQLTSEQNDVRLLALDGSANVIQRRDDVRLDAVLLEPRVDPNRGLDVLQSDENLHRSGGGEP